jgi:hypothetical protein
MSEAAPKPFVPPSKKTEIFVDCEHVLDPLPLPYYAVDDGCIQSLAYDRGTHCLEVRFKWKSVHQYCPVSLAVVRELWKVRPMSVALDKLVMKNRRIRFNEVRSDGKLLVSLFCGVRMLTKST